MIPKNQLILIVEDDGLIALHLQELLQNSGYVPSNNPGYSIIRYLFNFERLKLFISYYGGESIGKTLRGKADFFR